MLRRILRLPFALFLAIAYLLLGLLLGILPLPRAAKRKIQVRLVRFFTTLLLIFFHIKLEISGFNPVFKKQTLFILANHLSYVDIFILSSLLPTAFITSKEMIKTPLGQFALLGGSTFVERRDVSGLFKEIAHLCSILKGGTSLTLFPEATTGDGKKLLPFKTALLKAAIKSQTPLLPVVIQYKTLNRKELGTNNKDLVFYYGNMKFLPHIWQFLKIKSLIVTLDFLPIIPISNHLSRKALSEDIFESMQALYRPII